MAKQQSRTARRPTAHSPKTKGSEHEPGLDLRELLRALQSVRDGDFSIRLPSDKTGLAGKVADTFNEIVRSNQQMALELARVGQTVGKEGKTRHRMTVGQRGGSWDAMEACVNTLIDDMQWPMTEVTRTITAVAKGDLSRNMPLEVDGRLLEGEFLRSATAVNAMVQQVSAFTSEVTRVAREVGTEGKPGGQANVPGVAGTWKDLVDSVNAMATYLTGQVRNIVEVKTAVACGDVSREITVDVQDEILELKDTINTTLRDANRHKDEFLAMLAHELRNPLAPIHNALQLMRNAKLPPEQLVWAREVIQRQVAHLTKLVDDLLDVSRITRGKINVVRETIELATVVERAVETVQPMLMRQRHELIATVDPEPLLVDGDPTRLTQIVGNILSNAIKYTDEGGRIELNAGSIGDSVEIRVRDNGIGIEPEVLPLVFDLFAQASQLNGRSQTGLGIGLALAKRLAEMHGGDVQACSDGLGKGSEFIVRLPRKKSDAVAAARHADDVPASEPAASSAVRRILVADDNRDALETLARLLQLAGHEIHKAMDGVQALEAATRVRPDVVLLDIGMPGMDGYEVARRIRSQPWGQAATLVALTGWGQASDRKRSREAGFDTHCIKPLDPQRLSMLLASLSTPGGAAADCTARAGE